MNRFYSTQTKMALIAKAADVCHACLIRNKRDFIYIHYDVHINVVFRTHALMTISTYCLNFNVITNKSVCLVNHQITVNSYVALFNCMSINRATDFIMDRDMKL